jgi:two-component sensor histidine kinase
MTSDKIVVQSTDGRVRNVLRVAVGSSPLTLRVHQQSILAEFGRTVVHSTDLDELLRAAARLVAEGLGVECAKVLELLPTGGALLVRAGVGWRPGVVGVARIGADLESPAGFALHSGKPVLADDLATETRFRVPALIAEHGICSALNVIISGEPRPFGVLEVDSKSPQSFTADDISFLEGFANLLAAAIHRQKATELLAASLEEKSVLLRELQHRIKNNVQVIAGMVEIQLARSASPEIRRELQRLAQRLNALKLVHEQLRGAGQIGGLELSAYLREVCENVLGFQRDDGDAIALDLQLEEVRVGLDEAVPIGLIANEFLVNSLKHAFPNRRGTVRVRTERLPSGEIRLTLADDGIGLGAAQMNSNGLGLKLVAMLARQIDATSHWSAEGGTSLTLCFRA